MMSEEQPAGQWLALSEAAREAAERFHDAECRRMMYTLAARYEALEEAAKRLREATQRAQAITRGDPTHWPDANARNTPQAFQYIAPPDRSPGSPDRLS